MVNNYIVRVDNNTLKCFYYLKETGIACKTYERGRWGKAETIVKGTRGNFTIALDEQKNIFVFCQDSFGDILLCTNNSGLWQNKVILKNQAGHVYEILINPLMTNKGLSIIYNIPSIADKSSYLIFQQMDKDGKWKPATKIDKFTPMNDRLYHLQNVTSEHFLIFYQTRTPENNLGYRELTLDRQGAYNVFHTTAYPIIDNSFLTSQNSLHVSYITKSMFSCQLIYRKKVSEQFSNPMVIWEGSKLENCLLYFVENKLYISFLNNNQLYYCFSENGGNSFSKPIRYKNKFCLNPVKASYISGVPQSEGQFFTRQIYVDKNNVSDIQIFPDLYEEFYPTIVAPLNESVQSETENNFIQNEEINERNEEIMKLKNLLSLSTKQSNEKDKQILNMTMLLKTRSEEMNVNELEKRKLSKLHYTEKEELLGKLKLQEEDFSRINNEYKGLVENVEKDRRERKLNKQKKKE